jgi:hypothetical protein
MAQQATQEAVIKVFGALKGVVRISSFESLVGELKTEVARLLGELGFHPHAQAGTACMQLLSTAVTCHA